MDLKRLNYALLVLALFAASAHAATHFVTPDQVDWKNILPPPPTPGSDVENKEIEQMLLLQKTRTPEQIKQCKIDAGANAFTFAEALGSWFNPHDLPQTAKFLNQVFSDANSVSEKAKPYYDRKRPYVVDSRIKPCVDGPKSMSYPSGHSTRSTVVAMVVAEMFPEHRDALLEIGRRIGDNRVLGGVHFPSDVEAGRILAKAIFEKMKQNPDFHTAMEQAREECLAAEPGK